MIVRYPNPPHTNQYGNIKIRCVAMPYKAITMSDLS